MICLNNKFIFIHAPKVGGTSIESCLVSFNKSDNISSIRLNQNMKQLRQDVIFKNGDLDIQKHTKLKKIYKTWNNIYGNLNDFVKFGNIRNPWDRVMSYYFWQYKNETKLCKAKFLKILSRTALDPYYEYFTDSNSLYSLDYYIRFENLQNDFNLVCEKIGVPYIKIPHINQSKHLHYSAYYDDELREVIAKKYEKDIEYFGYVFN